jgi:enolase
VSLAVAKAAAEASAMPLYRYVGGPCACPAGADDEHHQWRRSCRQPDRHPGIHDHAGGAESIADAVRMGAEVFHTLKKTLKMPATTPTSATKAASRPICLGRRSARFHHEGGRKGRLQARRRHLLALDCAATEFYKDGKYELAGEGKRSTPKAWRNISPIWSTATRSSPSKTAWPRMTGTAGRP